jgi:hypothetical protein
MSAMQHELDITAHQHQISIGTCDDGGHHASVAYSAKALPAETRWWMCCGLVVTVMHERTPAGSGLSVYSGVVD